MFVHGPKELDMLDGVMVLSLEKVNVDLLVGLDTKRPIK